MTVKVRKWPHGWCVVIHHEGRRTVQTCKDEDQAEKLAEIMRNKLALEGAEALKTFGARKTPTFGAYSRRWLNQIERSELKQKTVDRYRSSLETHLLPKFKNRKLNQIRYKDLKDLCIRLRSDLKRRTIRNTIAVMRLILEEAIREDLIDHNPAKNLGRYYGERPEATVRVYSRDELERLLSAARENHYFEFILTLAFTGMRFGEARALKWEDLDFERRVVHVERSWPTHGGVSTTKTGKRRTVDLARRVERALKRLKAKRKEAALAKGSGEILDWVFVSPRGKRLRHRNFGRNWRKLQKEAGVPRLRIHDLRHTYASLLLAAGQPVTYVAAQLGHASVTTTLNTYAHWVEQLTVRGVDVLDEGRKDG